jgi:hypothetical protein
VLNDNWNKVSYKIGRSTQEGTEREAKHATECGHLTKLPLPTATQLYWKTEVKNSRKPFLRTPKPPPIYINFFLF